MREDLLTVLIDQVQSNRTKDYITNRILPLMEWYSVKSKKNRTRYHFWMTISISIGAMIPVLSVFADGAIWVKVLIATLSSAVTASNAYISLYNFKDLWMIYRNMRENLLRILYCYFNNAGAFSQSITQEEKDILLIDSCEEKISYETNMWMSVIKG
ncbi:hypothetical protein C823_000964 [Eubacterium plexicaudatum ASF492]|uniref:SMODS and SLOG-associating 2TM effector domain-containing protein n=1 Tax=Eubacterium plexicaudatum ASF492 TaxID=1235802 RepID=N1ZKN5_9FIRM|nr:hypothetical protein C823_000964 [Eubacterium plexicaudatum ASF492]